MNLFDIKTTKIVIDGEEHVAITKKEAEDFYKTIYDYGYSIGYNDGFQSGFEKVYWDDGK